MRTETKKVTVEAHTIKITNTTKLANCQNNYCKNTTRKRLT